MAMAMVGVSGQRNGGGGFGIAPNRGGVFLTDPTRWGAWAHQGHRLWASMSEEFWVYVYKVQRCPQPCSHDWTSCPYAHKGERARRRDPRRFSYVAVSCPDYRAPQLGAAPCCDRGLRCRYAHGVFELWLHPSRFRTRMCEAGPRCPRRICFFAHFAAELRAEDAAAAPDVLPPPPRILQRAPPLRHQFDLIVQAVPNRYSDAGASSSSSPAAAAAPVGTTAVPARTLLPDGGEDSAAKCSLCAEEDSMVNDYPHFDLIMDMMN